MGHCEELCKDIFVTNLWACCNTLKIKNFIPFLLVLYRHFYSKYAYFLSLCTVQLILFAIILTQNVYLEYLYNCIKLKRNYVVSALFFKLEIILF